MNNNALAVIVSHGVRCNNETSQPLYGSPCPASWALCLFAKYLADFLRYFSIKVYLSEHLSPYGSPCPASWALCLFAMHLADSPWYSSIKVFLNVDQWFPGPLENCLQLQRVVRGIEHAQGASPSKPCLLRPWSQFFWQCCVLGLIIAGIVWWVLFSLVASANFCFVLPLACCLICSLVSVLGLLVSFYRELAHLNCLAVAHCPPAG